MDAVRAAISVPGGGRFTDLTKVSRQLASLGSLDEIYEAAIRLGRDVLGFDRLSVWLVDPEDPERCVGTFGVDEAGNLRDERSRSFRLDPGGLTNYSDPIVVNHDVDLLNDQGEVIGHGASAFVVMWDGNDIIGLMTCDNLLTMHPVTEECRELLVMYAMALAALISKRRAEAALVEKERLFETIFDNAQIGIAQVAPDSSWIRVNQRLAEMFGYSKEELTGRNFRDVTHPDDLARNWELFKQAADGHRDHYEMVKRYVRKDGSEIWGRLNARAVADENGKLLYMISAVLDITDQVAAENEVRSVNQRLEAKVEERTAELSSALENLESFSYSVSHDLRGPLRAMNGFSRILLEDYGERLDEEGRSYLERIASASNRMAGLIDALLSLGRISRTELRRETLDLQELFSEFATDLGPHAFPGTLNVEAGT
ncbi:MAG TPA: PAS domain S-box protein, partial [Fimbriimonadaceae bacterium]|nr:PAS domain S-box protein [Fimbriimonadaceae bacterium]